MGKGLSLGCLVCNVSCVFVTFPCGVKGQVWYLIVSIPALCLFPYLDKASITDVRYCFLFDMILLMDNFPCFIIVRTVQCMLAVVDV